MSQENVERTRRVIEAFNRRDLQGYLELMDPELEFIPYEVYLEGGDPYLGHAGVRRWWEDLFSVVPDVRAEVFEVRDFGNRTLVHGRIYGQGAGSGAPIDRTMWLVTKWRGDKEVWWCAFETEEQALEAVGLSEQDAHADS
jgi:SnoaL-like domain